MKKLLALILFFPALAWGQAFPLFDPATGILKGQNNTYVTTAAASSDVIGLWTATCNSTTFLRGDGQCQTPSGSGIGTVTSVALTVPSGFSVSGSPITSTGTLAVTGILNVSAGGIGVGTLTGLTKGNGTSAFTAAASSDVISLWTGTCNSTTFLRADGSCQTVPGNTDASTLTVGTLADARLSANVPLKNVANTFTAAGISNSSAINNNSATPYYSWNESDAATNEHIYDFGMAAGQLCLRAVSDSSGTINNIFCADRTAAVVDSFAITAASITANGNAILTTASSLAATNLTGTVADVRLTANVPLLNANGNAFSRVGNNSLILANSSTGNGIVALQTNGATRVDLCSSTTASDCVTGDAANDASIRVSQKLNIVDNGTKVAVFDTAQIDLNATVVNANSSRINTVATSWKTAAARGSSAGALTRGLNITSVSRTTIGTYDINYTAAGFTGSPVCTVTPEGGGTAANLIVGSSTVVTVFVFDTATGNNTDSNFNVICNGP